MIDLILRSARIPGEDGYCTSQLVDLAVDGGMITDCGPHLVIPARHELELGGRLVTPGFVESHIHLDIALMNSWDVPGRTEPYLSHYGLNETLERRRKGMTRRDIERRAGAALELASRHGVTAMRAQCHVDPEVGLSHLEALLQVKEKYADRVNLQIVTFPQQGLLRYRGTLDLFREAFRLGADVMGCAPNLDVDENGKADFRKHIDTALGLAMELDVDLDVHADLSIAERTVLDDLEVVYLARRVMEEGYEGRVTAGHVCTLDSALPRVAKRAIELIHEAKINVVSQPDLYRLGRDDTHHVRRGLTRVKQLLAEGVNVAYASNNVRDPLRPFGNFDLLEEGLILAYGAHMDTIRELETIFEMSTYNAARILKLRRYGLQPGCAADLVVLDAPSPSAAIINHAEKNYVFKGGRLVASTRLVCECRELDELAI